MTTTIPAGWLPIESAPKDGTPVLLFARLAGVNFATNSPYAPTIHVGAYRTDLCIWTGSAYRDQREIEIEPTHWMPRPAFPDCAAPGVSTVEDAMDEQTAFERWYDRTCPSGDADEVQRQWEASSDYADFHAPAAGDALDALRELVECDNIKKRIASMQGCIPETEDDVQELDAMMSDLARRQPAAWDAARAALAAQRKGDA